MHSSTFQRTLLIAALAGAFTPVAALAQAPARVTGGMLQGASANGVDAFLGFPYAARRWARCAGAPRNPLLGSVTVPGNDIDQYQ